MYSHNCQVCPSQWTIYPHIVFPKYESMKKIEIFWCPLKAIVVSPEWFFLNFIEKLEVQDFFFWYPQNFFPSNLFLDNRKSRLFYLPSLCFFTFCHKILLRPNINTANILQNKTLFKQALPATITLSVFYANVPLSFTATLIFSP